MNNSSGEPNVQSNNSNNDNNNNNQSNNNNENNNDNKVDMTTTAAGDLATTTSTTTTTTTTRVIDDNKPSIINIEEYNDAEDERMVEVENFGNQIIPRALSDEIDPANRVKLKLLKLKEMNLKIETMDKLSSEFESVKDQISKTQKRTRTDEKSIQYGNKRNKFMDNNNNNNRNYGNANEKCETAENNNATKKLGVVTKLIQEEQVQQVMRYKFEKELNCLQGLQFGRLRLCCAKIRAGGYCRWAVTECPYHQRKPIIPPKYIRNQMVHALKEELKSEGWTFVDDDEQNRTNDMNLTHTFKKPVYIGIQQIRANLSMPVDIFSKDFFKQFLFNKKPLEYACKSYAPLDVQTSVNTFMRLVYSRYIELLRKLNIGIYVQECFYTPCLHNPCKCKEMPGKCKEDYRFTNIKSAMQKYKLESVKLRRGKIVNIFRQTDKIMYKDKDIFLYPDKNLVFNGPMPKNSKGQHFQYDWNEDPENILMSCKEAFQSHGLIFEIQLLDGTTEFWSAAYLYASANRLQVEPLGSTMVGITFGEEQSPARVLKTQLVLTEKKAIKKMYYVIYEEKRQSIYYLDELELCRRILNTPHANCSCPSYDHLDMLKYQRKVLRKYRYDGENQLGLNCLKLYIERDFPSDVFVNDIYGRYHGVDLEVHLMDVNSNKLYANGQSEMIPGMATLVYADTMEKVDLQAGDAGLEIVDDRSEAGALPSMLVFFGGVMKIRLRITSLSSNHGDRKFRIRFKVDPRWKDYCKNIDTDTGKWPEVFTTPISVKNTMLTTVIKQAKYLVDYEPSNLYFASLLKQLKNSIQTSNELSLFEDGKSDNVDTNIDGNSTAGANIGSSSSSSNNNNNNNSDNNDNNNNNKNNTIQEKQILAGNNVNTNKSMDLESRKKKLLREINLYHQRTLNKKRHTVFQLPEAEYENMTSSLETIGHKSDSVNTSNNFINRKLQKNSTVFDLTNDEVTTTTSSNINNQNFVSNNNNTNNNNVKMMMPMEIDDTNNNTNKNDNKQTYYKIKNQIPLFEIEEEANAMKQPAIETGIFQDGTIPNETDSDYEFADVEDLFDDEENYLVGKHVEIYSQSHKAWNTAYVLRYVRGIHHVLYYHGVSEWADLTKVKFRIRSGMVCKFCGESFRNIENYKIHIDCKCEVRKNRLLQGFEARQNLNNEKDPSGQIQIHRDITVASHMDQTLLKHTGVAIQKYTNLLAKERSRTSRMIDKYKFWKKKYKDLKAKVEAKKIDIDEVAVEKMEHEGSSVSGRYADL